MTSVCTLGTLVAALHTGIQTFDDQASWESAVNQLGMFSTITFTEVEPNSFVTREYVERFGVEFVDGTYQAQGPGCVVFPEDCFGLDAVAINAGITMNFSTPQQWLAVNYPGSMEIDLYHGDILVGSADDFPIGGFGFFAGVLSDAPFDRVVLSGIFGVEIDNLHFGGPAIPTPSASALFVSGLLLSRRKRRQ